MSIDYWCHYVGSLTAELNRVSSGELTFSFLGAEERPLSHWESEALVSPLLQKAWVRKVIWQHNEVLHVMAKAIIPAADSAPYRVLRDWDERPLGHLLYQHDVKEQEPWMLSPDQGYVLHRARLLFFDGHPILLSEQMTQPFIDRWEVS